jgi:hypothetical protein
MREGTFFSHPRRDKPDYHAAKIRSLKIDKNVSSLHISQLPAIKEASYLPHNVSNVSLRNFANLRKFAIPFSLIPLIIQQLRVGAAIAIREGVTAAQAAAQQF